MASHNLVWISALVNWITRSGWTEIIWSIKVMAMGLVSEDLLIEPPGCLALVFHGILWDFPNRQETQGRNFWPCWYSCWFPLSWIIRGGNIKCNGSACGAKPKSPSCHIPRGLRLTTYWPCPPSWDRILQNNCQLPPSWWGVGTDSWLDLGCLILLTGSLLGPKYEYF